MFIKLSCVTGEGKGPSHQVFGNCNYMYLMIKVLMPAFKDVYIIIYWSDLMGFMSAYV